jgi:spore germination protein
MVKCVVHVCFLVSLFAFTRDSFAVQQAGVPLKESENQAAVSDEKPAKAVPEIWAYLVEGCEKAYGGKEPITDLCYFRAVVNYKGELVGAKEFPASVLIREGVRKHLVIAELSNTALSHFILQNNSSVREKLIEDIVKNSEGFEGVQIDFESVHAEDKNEFFSFLKDLKDKMRGKILSVAVPARTRLVDDAFNYEVLREIADRLIIMAYDEHWKGSTPGPVASMEWCEKVARYTKTVIPKEKLIMGVPLYGRSWQNTNYSKEMNYAEAKKLSSKKAQNAKNPKVEYQRSVKVTVFFESASSIMSKVKMYSKNDIESVAFWRMGQGPEEVWPMLKKFYDAKQ